MKTTTKRIQDKINLKRYLRISSAQRGFDPTESERVDNSVRRYFQLTTMMEHVNPEFDEKKYWTYGCNCLVLGKKSTTTNRFYNKNLRWPTHVWPRQRTTSWWARLCLQSLQGLHQVCQKDSRRNVSAWVCRVQVPNHKVRWNHLPRWQGLLWTRLVHVRQDVRPK